MRFNRLIPMISLLLAACSLQTVPTLPANLQPAAAQALPQVASATAAGRTPAPAGSRSITLPTPDSPTPIPTQPSEPTAAPPPTITPTPVQITGANAGELRPVAIYPLFRRGLLHSVRWSPDGSNLIVETNLGIQVLSAPGLQKRFSLPDVSALYFLTGGDLLVQKGKDLSRLSLADGGNTPLQAEMPEAGPFALSPNGQYWITAPDGDALRVDDLQAGTSLTVSLKSKTLIALHVEELSFSPDGSRLFAMIRRVDNETESIAVDTAAWKQTYEIFGVSSAPVYSPDGQRMLFTSSGSVDVYTLKDGKRWVNFVRQVESHPAPDQTSMITAQAFSFLNGPRMLGVLYTNQTVDSQARDGQFLPSTLTIYNTDTSKTERNIENLPARVIDFAFSPDGNAFITTSQDGMLRLWDTTTGKIIKTGGPYETDPTPHIRADGRLAAYAVADHIALVDPATGKNIAVLGSYAGASHLSARFVGDRDLAVFVETPWQRFIETWDIGTEKPLYRYPDVGSCTFNSTGTVMTCFDGVLHFYDLPEGRSLLDHVPQGSRFSWAVNDAGTRAAYCTAGSEAIYVWELQRGSIPKYVLGGEPGACGDLAFSPDGEQLASSSGFFWNVMDGSLVKSFDPLAGGPTTISHGDDLLLVYPQLVNLKTGQVLEQLQSVPGIQEAYFQPDGRTLVLQTQRGIEFWMIGEP